MIGEIDNCNLKSYHFEMHQACIFEIWNLVEILDKPETENDKEEMFKAIEYCRSRYNLFIEEINSKP